MFNNAHVLGIWGPAEVPKFRRVPLEPICSNSGRAECRIVLLKFPKSVRMHNGHEWVQGPWIHEVVHHLDAIGNEIRQTMQRVSSHQQSNVDFARPRRGKKLCVVQSTRVHEWAIVSEGPYR
ncbi:uncharacterized protein TNCV_1887891 [Trichonephila clavipes]|nr:uncharacterized protein TNCV_1887891 [Trichonephila clavipes]